MSKKDLQKSIREEGGFILSDGTMNLQHLLPKALDVINDFKLRGGKHGIGDLRQSIIECFRFRSAQAKEESLKHGLAWVHQYHGRMELKEYRHGGIALDPHDVWYACEDFFNSIAPNGYYFGSSEGDGACIGWFVFESEED